MRTAIITNQQLRSIAKELCDKAEARGWISRNAKPMTESQIDTFIVSKSHKFNASHRAPKVIRGSSPKVKCG